MDQDRGIDLNQNGINLASGWQEAFSPYWPWLLWAAGLLALPLVFSANPYWQRIVCMVCIYGLLALGFDFLAHYAGLVCLGGAFFIGVGGYLTAIFNTHWGLPPAAAIPAATLLGAIFCTLVFYPCLSLKGIYFAIVSLMYPLLARRVIEALDIFGGTEGILGVEGFETSWTEQYVLIFGLLIAFFALKRLVTADAGLVLTGIRDNDQAVRASGINIIHYKTLAVFLASVLGCLAGAVLSHIYLWAGISLFALDFSILPVAATVVGGAGTLAGPILGCAVLVPLSELLRDFGSLRIVVYAVILTALVVGKSQGLWAYGFLDFSPT